MDIQTKVNPVTYLKGHRGRFRNGMVVVLATIHQ